MAARSANPLRTLAAKNNGIVELPPYCAQPKQEELHRCPANEILFGGQAGPGKSVALRQEALSWCLRIPGLQAYLFRRTYPDLEKNHILPSLESFPRNLAKYKDQKRRWEFTNGSMLHFAHCQYEKDVFNYLGAEINWLGIDELTTFSEFIYDFLRARVRCTLDVPEHYRHKIPGILAVSNPGGVGHNFVKRRWVSFADPGQLKRADPREGGMLRCFIKAKLSDNPILLEKDPNYVHRLDALPEPLRSAYKDGNWDIFLGQAFDFSTTYHVINPMPVPRSAPIYMTFDWGYGKPFSVLWFWVDADGRLYLFAEWYGALGEPPDTGLRMVDEDIAKGILAREEKMRFTGRRIMRYADPTCWNKKPDYRGGGQGPSTAEVFAWLGINMIPGDASRHLKIRQFHQRLRVPEDENQRPMLQVYDTCIDFIRTIPLLQTDQNDPEDLNTTLEDHCYDSACLVFMARPISMETSKTRKSYIDKRIEDLTRGDADDFEREAIEEHHAMMNEFGQDNYDYGTMKEYDDDIYRDYN